MNAMSDLLLDILEQESEFIVRSLPSDVEYCSPRLGNNLEFLHVASVCGIWFKTENTAKVVTKNVVTLMTLLFVFIVVGFEAVNQLRCRFTPISILVSQSQGTKVQIIRVRFRFNLSIAFNPYIRQSLHKTDLFSPGKFD